MELAQASTIAGRETLLIYSLTALSAVFALGVFGAMFYFCWRYRAGSAAPRENPVYYSRKLEGVWIGSALVLGMGMFSWGAVLFLELYGPPAQTQEIYVLGKQWMWKVYHPSGRTEINEIHVPRGAPVSLILASQDVVHSLAIPAFRVKMDAVPGRYTRLWFEATKNGQYHFFCNQFCGSDHARMLGIVTVMDPAAYRAWASEKDLSIEQQGEALTAKLGCRACHSPFNADKAPKLEGLFRSEVPLADGTVRRADEDYLRRAIDDPAAELVRGYSAVMPSFHGQLSEEELLQLVAYIKSLKNEGRMYGEP